MKVFLTLLFVGSALVLSSSADNSASSKSSVCGSMDGWMHGWYGWYGISHDLCRMCLLTILTATYFTKKTIFASLSGTVHCSCPNGHAFNVACPAGLDFNKCCDNAELTNGCSGSKIVTSNSRLVSSASSVRSAPSPLPPPTPSSRPDFIAVVASSAAASAGEWNGLAIDCLLAVKNCNLHSHHLHFDLDR